jgi:hypothetical protein
MNQTFIPVKDQPTRAAIHHAWMLDLMLTALLVFIPNFILALHFSQPLIDAAHVDGFFKRIIASYADLQLNDCVTWLAVNLITLGLLFTLRQLVLRPLGRIAQHLQQIRSAYNKDNAGTTRLLLLNVWHIASDVGQFASFAVEYYRRYQETNSALEQARVVIAQFAIEQKAILNSTNREIAQQYRSVLSYANYLEEQIVSKKLDPNLRYDLDDVCESSFNLKLIAGAFSMLNVPPPTSSYNVPLAPLMQQTMVALAPSLDRRSMKLTTAEVDMSVAAYGDPGTLAHILWMMLLGMIRYAADESTLRIRCLHNRDGTQAIMSIVVSELSPNRLSEDERGEHLARQLEHLTPHMFAETIRIHGNVQLADLLIQRISGAISVLPLTISSCEICVTLPCAKIDRTC